VVKNAHRINDFKEYILPLTKTETLRRICFIAKVIYYVVTKSSGLKETHSILL
jgi:hypothetical protein